MPGAVKTKEEERLWSKAKARAKEEGKAENWAYVMGIFQRMKGNKSSALRSTLVRLAHENPGPVRETLLHLLEGKAD